MSKIVKILIIFTGLLLLNECGLYEPVDSRKTPVQGKDRARKNVEEGRGISLKGLGNRKTTYQFSSSNPPNQTTANIVNKGTPRRHQKHTKTH